MVSTKCVACEVQFIGGRIDGHVETFDYPPALFIAATVSRDSRIGSWLWRWLPWSRFPRTVAFYELDEADGLLRYRHTGSATSVPDTLQCIAVKRSSSGS
jgi:hypothetical protein